MSHSVLGITFQQQDESMIGAMGDMWIEHCERRWPHMSADTPEHQRLQSLLKSILDCPLEGKGETLARCKKIRWLVRSILNQREITGTPTVRSEAGVGSAMILECLLANHPMPYTRERLLRIYGDCQSVERLLG